jgi:ATP-binding cassette subfamily B protein
VKTEGFIISAMEKLVHGRTTFMIAHRLSTLERCDQVLVLREGHLTSIASDLQQARRELLNNPEQPAGPNLGPVLVR